MLVFSTSFAGKPTFLLSPNVYAARIHCTHGWACMRGELRQIQPRSFFSPRPISILFGCTPNVVTMIPCTVAGDEPTFFFSSFRTDKWCKFPNHDHHSMDAFAECTTNFRETKHASPKKSRKNIWPMPRWTSTFSDVATLCLVLAFSIFFFIFFFRLNANNKSTSGKTIE